MTTVRSGSDTMKEIIAMNGWDLPDSVYQADKADKADILEKTSLARERITSPHDAHDIPDMQISGGGFRGELF